MRRLASARKVKSHPERLTSLAAPTHHRQPMRRRVASLILESSLQYGSEPGERMSSHETPTQHRLPWQWGVPAVVDAPGGAEHFDSRMRLATRSVYTSAEPAALFLWLCQLRRAPYSYDWI